MNNKKSVFNSIKTKFATILTIMTIVFLFVSVFAILFNIDTVMTLVSNYTYRMVLSDFSHGAIDIDVNTSEIILNDNSLFDFDFLDDEKIINSFSKRNYAVNCFDYNEQTGDYQVFFSSVDDGVDDVISEEIESVLAKKSCAEEILGNYDYNCFYFSGVDSTGNKKAISFIFDIKEAMSTLFGVLNFFIGFVIIAIAVAMIVSSSFVNTITNNIVKINDYLKKIGKSSLPEEELHISSKDELGQMSNTVNTMVEELREKQTMDEELKFAARVQMNFLPNYKIEDERVDVAAYIKPARNVGGDFYDYILIDENRLGFLIADVSGKGTPASMLMSMEINEMRNSIRTCNTVSEAVIKANNELCKENITSHFVTMWAGILDLSTGVVKFVNAGHNKPLIKKKDTGFEFINIKHNPAIGLVDNIAYKENEITLNDGEMLYLYTDGIVEATNKESKLYGNDRLKVYLNDHKESSVTELVEGTINSVNEFVGEEPQFDDMTLLVLKYNKR
ncbi:MAG: PP2C family protein-serine/threonine phosphatase [Erysipelotrichaceae bacterium]|nr:PP2C family protein-serine/threonine phosphatase [Erysipelotrichaceae bacterium]